MYMVMLVVDLHNIALLPVHPVFAGRIFLHGICVLPSHCKNQVVVPVRDDHVVQGVFPHRLINLFVHQIEKQVSADTVRVREGVGQEQVTCLSVGKIQAAGHGMGHGRLFLHFFHQALIDSAVQEYVPVSLKEAGAYHASLCIREGKGTPYRLGRGKAVEQAVDLGGCICIFQFQGIQKAVIRGKVLQTLFI